MVSFLDAASACRSAWLEDDRISSTSFFLSLMTEAILSLSDLSPDDSFNADEAVSSNSFTLPSWSACTLWSLVSAAFNLVCRAVSSFSEVCFVRRAASSDASINSWIFFSFSAVTSLTFSSSNFEFSFADAVSADMVSPCNLSTLPLCSVRIVCILVFVVWTASSNDAIFFEEADSCSSSSFFFSATTAPIFSRSNRALFSSAAVRPTEASARNDFTSLA